MQLALSFDIGGTFTDFVVVNLESGDIVDEHKVLTDPADPSRAALRGLLEMVDRGSITAADLVNIVHATTLVTNAVIERKGATTAFLTTAGFRDLLSFGREQMYDIYDLFADPAIPLVPESMRFEADERITRDGSVLRELDVATIAEAVAPAIEEGASAVAVGFLHSYRDPRHERSARDAILSRWPEVEVSISSDTAPIIGEFERFTTTTVDAYVKGLVRNAVGDLRERLVDVGVDRSSDFHIMTSQGGIVSSSEAIDRPVRLLESGPAAGALVASFHGALAGRTRVLSLDMGGTTAKACMIEDGEPGMAPMLEAARVQRFKPGSGLPVVIPVVDLIEIGAGGGSIARVDELGLLKVGPESSGADPGPACYGAGGTEPTVTDANLLLGYLSEETPLGGSLNLQRQPAEQSVARLAEQLGITALETAWGIHSVANEAMAAASRIHAIEKNRDPRDFTLIAFGGAGPTHASAVARILGMPEAIYPMGAGVASALGCLVAPPTYSLSRSLPSRLSTVDWKQIDTLYREMESEAVEVIAGTGVAAEQVEIGRSVDLRMAGQFHDLTISFDGAPGLDLEARLIADFHQLYADRYGTALVDGLDIEVTTWRLDARGAAGRVQLAPLEGSTENATVGLTGSRIVCFGGRERDCCESTIYRRDLLRPGMEISGPAIVEETNTTIVLRPGDRGVVNEYGALIVQFHEPA